MLKYGEFFSCRWEDFDHSQKLSLGVLERTWCVQHRETGESLILQSCPGSEFNKVRFHLLQIAAAEEVFVTPRCGFTRKDRLYVCSTKADTGITLADLLSCSIPFTGVHVAAIVKQVGYLIVFPA
jgi:hypothetical protein